MSAKDQLKINSITKANGTYAIGYNDGRSGGNFTWSDGKKSNFTNWLKKDSRDGNLEDHCTRIAYQSPFFGKWDAYKCNRRMQSICKVPSKHFFFI